MLESIIEFFSLDTAITLLESLPWYWVLIFAFVATFVENIFPPSPSDAVLVFIGGLASIGVVSFFPLLLSATLGSTIGFMFMYWLGYKFGLRIIDSNKISFINKKSMEKPALWFSKYGYYLIVANRFLSGTRAFISFFAGISKLSFTKTTILSALSAGIWNTVLIVLGITFANNIDLAFEYITMYGKIILPIFVIGIIAFIYKEKIVKFIKKLRS